MAKSKSSCERRRQVRSDDFGSSPQSVVRLASPTVARAAEVKGCRSDHAQARPSASTTPVQLHHSHRQVEQQPTPRSRVAHERGQGLGARVRTGSDTSPTGESLCPLPLLAA